MCYAPATMERDPRRPDPATLVRTESAHPAHADMRRTLVLLKLDVAEGPIYFVVEGLHAWPATIGELRDEASYFYEESTCPTNFIGAVLISQGGDHDPHGLFDFVDVVWMLDEYLAAKAEGRATEYLSEAFEQLR
jgi:hypothetical protein